VRGRTVLPFLVGFGPALAWVAVVSARYGPTDLGWPRSVALAVFTGLGVLGLSALALAYLPVTLERLGLARAAAWLRRFWDPDAR